MKITKQRLKLLVESLILNEGQVEDLLAANPQLGPAVDSGIRNPNHLRWLLRMEKFEPIADIAGLIPAFIQNKQRLAIKDLDLYKNPNVLRAALEEVGESEGDKRRQLRDNETDIVYNDEQWIVVMPHTMESSIQWGKGTTWCTASTKSRNLFYSHVGRKEEDIVLFYAIRKGVNSKIDPNAKLSVGFNDGTPLFGKEGEHGGLTVNASNNNLTESSVKEIFDSKFDIIMSAITSHSEKIEGKHPAKKAMQKIALSKNPNILDKYTFGMNLKEKKDFIKILLEYDLSSEMSTLFARDEDKEVRSAVARNHGTSAEVLTLLSRDEDEVVRKAVASNTSTPPAVLSRFVSDESSSIRLKAAAAENPNIPIEVLNLLARSKEYFLRTFAARNPSTPIETLTILASDKHDDVREAVAENPNTPPEILDIFERNEEEWARQSKAENPNTSAEDLTRLANDKSYLVKSFVAQNPNTPVETLVHLASDKDMRPSLAQNPNTPPEILISIASDKGFWPRAYVSKNPSTPTEILSRLASDDESAVRMHLATNPRVPIEDLIRLVNDKDLRVKGNAGQNPTYKKYLASKKQLAERWIRLAGLI